MPNLLQHLTRSVARWPTPLPFPDVTWPYANIGGLPYPLGLNQTLAGNTENIPSDFPGLVQWAYKSNGIVFACMLVRQMLFAEARFQWRPLRSGQGLKRSGDETGEMRGYGPLFGNTDLSILEHPEPGKTTGDLLTRVIQDADLAGNCFLVRRSGRIKRLRPDWVTIAVGSNSDPDMTAVDIDAEVLGIAYQEGGRGSGTKPRIFLPSEYAHFAPIPDPLFFYRGMSWLSPILREIAGDSAATSHKLKFFEQGATPNMVIKAPPLLPRTEFEEWEKLFRKQTEGTSNAYRTLILGAGADTTTVGSNFQQIDFKVTQGAGESRIAAAAGVHPTIVGLSEGLQGSSLNSGNFAAARRLTADKTLRPLWRNICGSLETIVPPPPGCNLWFDESGIAFLREDATDLATINQTKAATIVNLIAQGGMEPKSVIDAVESGDMTRLVHTGLPSVQLQPPPAQLPTGPNQGPAPAGPSDIAKTLTPLLGGKAAPKKGATPNA